MQRESMLDASIASSTWLVPPDVHRVKDAAATFTIRPDGVNASANMHESMMRSSQFMINSHIHDLD